MVYYIVVCGVILGGLVLLGEILGGKNPSRLKQIPYECGIIPRETFPHNFIVPYFGYALLFLVFDVDIVIFYFLVGVKISLFYFVLIFLFLLLGFVGIGFAYKLGIFKWD
jgi:NADH-quinone oxidoreductase subunit A